MSSPEQHNSSERKLHTAGNREYYQGAPRSRELEHSTEHGDRLEKAHKALAEASKEAVSHTEYVVAEQQESQPAPALAPSKKGRQQSFNKTMQQTRAKMPARARAFSKVIHLPAIENASNIVGSTVARPDAILSGSLCAFLLTLVVYVTARYIGFEVTGTVAIAAFIIGWVIGIIFDMLRTLLRRRSR